MTGSIALTKLVHVMKKAKSGQMCMVIPVDDNYLEKDKDGNYYIPIRVNYMPEGDKFNQNGFIAKSIPSKVYKAADDKKKEEFKEHTPILGSIKDWSADNTPNAVGQALGPDDDDDDLPF